MEPFTLENHCEKILLDIYMALDGNPKNTDFLDFRLNTSLGSFQEDIFGYSVKLISDLESMYENLTEEQKIECYGDLDLILFQKTQLQHLRKYWSYSNIYRYIDQLEMEISLYSHIV